MGKNILVTGGAGFVGGYLCRALKKKGHMVVALDNMSNGKMVNVPEGVPLIKVDLASRKLSQTLTGYKFDVVIHCAAQSSNAISFKFPHEDLEANQLGTLNLLEYCVAAKIKRFIFTSSMSAYGQPKQLPTKESYNCQPDSFYAVHKLASEHYVRIFGQIHKLNYTIFRLYTTYGHGQNLSNMEQGLLSIYLGYILKKEKLIVKGSKDRTRDIIHVNDVVRAITASLFNSKSFGKVYNLGTGKRLKIGRIIELLTTGLGYKKGQYPVVYIENTLGDPFDTLANIQEAKKDLSWKPLISAEEGIRLTVGPYQKKG